MAFAVENKDTEAGSKQADDIVGAVDIRETVASPETALKIFRDMKPGLTPQKLLASTRRMFEGEAMRALLTLPAEQQEAETRLAMALTASRRMAARDFPRSEEHTSELQSLMRISYAVFCLQKKKIQHLNKHCRQQSQISPQL